MGGTEQTSAGTGRDRTGRPADLIRSLAEGTGKRGQREQARALGVSTTRLNAYLKGAIPPEETLIKMLRAAGVPESKHVVYLRVRNQALATKSDKPYKDDNSLHDTQPSLTDQNVTPPAVITPGHGEGGEHDHEAIGEHDHGERGEHDHGERGEHDHGANGEQAKGGPRLPSRMPQAAVAGAVLLAAALYALLPTGKADPAAPATPAAGEARCAYVIEESAPVYPEPDATAVAIKFKYRQDRVELLAGPHPPGWVAVRTPRDRPGFNWMRSAVLGASGPCLPGRPG
ncbi:hypothetical protein Psi01_41560 [Planobispora siamensis]|uniref:HTH cro/C1-type domain-containing protein n=1 Tax=Planobispora siamensis TaxID=936338 RepID=A0A8J3WN61_9ACTN|nr:helix-turn-helix transcriptional regulator [Planobispora siamensis]GIH93526.1 hypothetical protein Psi01_41560 [Planobispora siamensis]